MNLCERMVVAADKDVMRRNKCSEARESSQLKVQDEKKIKLKRECLARARTFSTTRFAIFSSLP